MFYHANAPSGNSASFSPHKSSEIQPILPKQVICLICPVGRVNLFALSAGLCGAWGLVIVWTQRGPTGWGARGEHLLGDSRVPGEHLRCREDWKKPDGWHTFALDRHVGVWTPWGQHPAEAFSVGSNVSNYAASVNPGPLTKHRQGQNSLVEQELNFRPD